MRTTIKAIAAVMFLSISIVVHAQTTDPVADRNAADSMMRDYFETYAQSLAWLVSSRLSRLAA